MPYDPLDTAQAKRVAARYRIAHGSRFPLSLRVITAAMIFMAILWLGAALAHTWIQAHPCLVAPGGSVVRVIRQHDQQQIANGDRQTIQCNRDGSVYDVSYWWWAGPPEVPNK